GLARGSRPARRPGAGRAAALRRPPQPPGRDLLRTRPCAPESVGATGRVGPGPGPAGGGRGSRGEGRRDPAALRPRPLPAGGRRGRPGPLPGRLAAAARGGAARTDVLLRLVRPRLLPRPIGPPRGGGPLLLHRPRPLAAGPLAAFLRPRAELP